MKKYRVVFKKYVEKQARRLPIHIQMALRTWVLLIEEHGISAMRKIPSYHDEGLKGNRLGQRSSRLSKGYRVFYEEDNTQKIMTIIVVEVNKHEY